MKKTEQILKSSLLSMFIVLVTALSIVNVSKLSKEFIITNDETSIDEGNSNDTTFFFAELEEENEEKESSNNQNVLQFFLAQKPELLKFTIGFGKETNSFQLAKIPLFISQCCLKIPLV